MQSMNMIKGHARSDLVYIMYSECDDIITVTLLVGRSPF